MDKKSISPEKLQELIDDVPDIGEPEETCISYWQKANDKMVYLEGWADACLAGTGFPLMEEGETARKVAYIEDLTPEILQRKAKEKGLKLLEGGFKETPDAENLYGVTYGIYEKAEGGNPMTEENKRPRYGIDEARVREIAREEVRSELPPDHEMLLHFGIEEVGSPGIVLDEARARATPCSCFFYKGKDLCWSRGILGMLKQEQEDIYCVAGKTYKAQPKLVERYTTFAAAAERAHKEIESMPKGTERLKVWLSAMGRELAKEGIEV